jgi:hypothetical protein
MTFNKMSGIPGERRQDAGGEPEELADGPGHPFFIASLVVEMYLNKYVSLKFLGIKYNPKTPEIKFIRYIHNYIFNYQRNS